MFGRPFIFGALIEAQRRKGKEILSYSREPVLHDVLEKMCQQSSRAPAPSARINLELKLSSIRDSDTYVSVDAMPTRHYLTVL